MKISQFTNLGHVHLYAIISTVIRTGPDHISTGKKQNLGFGRSSPNGSFVYLTLIELVKTWQTGQVLAWLAQARRLVHNTLHKLGEKGASASLQTWNLLELKSIAGNT
ncbi:hypothetical protein GUJ93_ZPchr0001g33217 [Zizania palustris]|uniref:Uncharacterized protein n=1 Tax=Zizania palustris TaxID=103762 RepID=A0A8J5V270_ZIZPA|nr:hypothetical protein GUJ93_ZPchr0001g33217 [Zizania palustris]